MNVQILITDMVYLVLLNVLMFVMIETILSLDEDNVTRFMGQNKRFVTWKTIGVSKSYLYFTIMNQNNNKLKK